MATSMLDVFSPFIPKVLPIDFDLLDDNEESVLFITDDVAGQKLTLEIKNQSDQSTTPKKLTGQASASNWHFQLVFRPGVVFNRPAAMQLLGSDFEMFAEKDGSGNIKPNPDGTISLYFKAKSEWTMEPGGKVTIQLHKIRAAKQGGTRGTRVMLKYQNLLYMGSQDAFSGFKEMQMNIVNHQGRRHIPLHVGFVGSNSVLNDGSHTNTLRLRVTNSSLKHQALEANPATSEAKSKLVLSLEGGRPSQEWTLATNDQLSNAKISAEYTDWNDPSKDEPQSKVELEVVRATGANEWEIPFKKLEESQYIDILIDKLVTGHPTGFAKLSLHYENIPGYWDGEKVITIEKSPLTTIHNAVGIGQVPDENVAGQLKAEEVKAVKVTATKEVNINLTENSAGLNVYSSSGNTHFPWTDNRNYISGDGTVFRNSHNENKVVIDLKDSAASVQVQGKIITDGLRVKSNDQFNRIQAGHVKCGSNSGGVKTITVRFKQPFQLKPMCVCTVRNEPDTEEIFCVTTRWIDREQFKVNIMRMDQQMAGWSQDLRLDWFAFELDGYVYD